MSRVLYTVWRKSPLSCSVSATSKYSPSKLTRSLIR